MNRITRITSLMNTHLRTSFINMMPSYHYQIILQTTTINTETEFYNSIEQMCLKMKFKGSEEKEYLQYGKDLWTKE